MDFRDAKNRKDKIKNIVLGGIDIKIVRFVTMFPCTAIRLEKNNVPLSVTQTMNILKENGFNEVFEFRKHYLI